MAEGLNTPTAQPAFIQADISGSTVNAFNVPLFQFGPFTNGGVTIAGGGFTFPSGGGSSALFDTSITGNNVPFTETITGVPLIAGKKYDFFVFTNPLFGSTSGQYNLNYGATTSGLQSRQVGQFASLTSFTANGTDTLGITVVPDAVGNYAGFSGFAVVAVPEPASIALLGFGSMAVLARRRRA